jgi:hypothetical protein
MAMKTHTASRRRHVVHALERGDGGDSFEFTLGIIPVTMMMLIIGAVTIIRPAQLPVWIAARECARASAATLNATIGTNQGREAALNSLRGNPLTGVDVGGISISASHAGVRGGNAQCTVRYQIDVSTLPMVGGVFGSFPIESRVTMVIDPYKSRWGN